MELTTAGAIVRYLAAQRIALDDLDPDVADQLVAISDDESVPLFGGVYAIFGHGNVTCLGPELHRSRHVLPTWRGQNEQGMALAGVGFARAMRRRRIMAATSSIGPGATNMITAAAAAHANRIPLLLLAGDTFSHRLPDPVLQQVEHFGDPSITVNDAFRSVVRYWDRLITPEQVMQSLPNAVATMLDPADCGPAFIGLPQDVQAQTGSFPSDFFEPVVHHVRRPRADRRELAAAAQALTRAKRPLLLSGGGVRWSMAEAQLRSFAERHNIPIVETVAGRTSFPSSHALACGPIGVTGCTSANAMAAAADVVLAVGTRLGDFATGSWTLFDHQATFIGLNTARFDATKHSTCPLVADAREGLAELSDMLGDYTAPPNWSARAESETAQYHAYIDKLAAPEAHSSLTALPTYAQVVGAVARSADERTYVVTAAGGLPGETVNGWRSDIEHSFDCEYGYSTMGYEIAGAWGAKQALPHRNVVALVGDGSYLMMNSDLYSSVLSGHPITVVVCDNGGFAVINRLQQAQGGVSFNNFLADTMTQTSAGVEDRSQTENLPQLVPARVNFAAHAASMGCETHAVATIAELEEALERAKSSERTYVIVLSTHPTAWTEGGATWQVGVPNTSHRTEITEAAAVMAGAMTSQRRGS